MNNKVIYIVIFVSIMSLLFMVKENFTWFRPGFDSETYTAHCNINKLPNCAVVSQVDQGKCDQCIFYDRLLPDFQQMFVPKNKDDPLLKGVGGCELNTQDPSSYYTIQSNNCIRQYDGSGADYNTRSIDTSGNCGPDGFPGCADIAPLTAGWNRFLVNANGSCIPGAFPADNRYARWEDDDGVCKAKNFYRQRCIADVSLIKTMVTNGIIPQIDELPDTGTVKGIYHRMFNDGRHDC